MMFHTANSDTRKKRRIRENCFKMEISKRNERITQKPNTVLDNLIKLKVKI